MHYMTAVSPRQALLRYGVFHHVVNATVSRERDWQFTASFVDISDIDGQRNAVAQAVWIRGSDYDRVRRLGLIVE